MRATDLPAQGRQAGALPDLRWHALPAEDALRALGSAPGGLDAAEAEARLRAFGANVLPQPERDGPLARFLRQFHNVLIYVLLGSSMITALLGHWVDTAVILGVVLINAVVGFIQEGRAETALAAIRRMLSVRAMVMRAGRTFSLPADRIVPGDLVLVQSGDRVPADLRLIRVKGLRVDEASLTGESLPVEKDVAPVGEQAVLGDRSCLAFSGTLATYGSALGVAVATGARTELGRISTLIEQTERIETPLLRKMSEFGRRLSVAIVLFSAATFAFGVWGRGYAAEEMFLAAVGLAVAAIPEGLPAIMTITLAIGVQRMARRNAIVRLLPAVEALGSVTVICSDKTGTLTRNEMTVRSLAVAAHRYRVDGVGYEPRGAFQRDGAPAEAPADGELLELLRGGLLCNDAALHSREGRWTIDGDPTEGALVVAAVKAGLEPATEHELRPRTDLIPFESERRFMATLHHDHTGNAFVYVKGAPERVLEMCSRERAAEGERPIDAAYWHARAEEFAARGERVLALAWRTFPRTRRDLRFDDVCSGLVLLGLFGMVDPPREEAIRAVAACREAGIRVKMITGDHLVTASAIAAQLGLERAERAVSGRQLEALDDAALERLAREVDVYARVSPEHKLRLVQALQARGEVVAMTGDGVNDAPALKRADVGVAMGAGGTEAAKEAAEIVLADDNFASIASAVEEGRTVYDNLRKAILFILPTNGGEAGTLVAAIALGVALPILPVQILWVNMITAVTLSLALAFEPSEPGAMRRPPRDPGTPIFSRYFLWRTLLVSLVIVAGTFGLFLWEQANGASLEAARTAAVNALVLYEAFYLLGARYLLAPAGMLAALRENAYIWAMIALVLVFQLVYTYAPFMQVLFHGEALGPAAWARIVLVSAPVYAIVELEKRVVRRAGWRLA
jgi:magnesium-transporting ATPase (P-type)